VSVSADGPTLEVHCPYNLAHTVRICGPRKWICSYADWINNSDFSDIVHGEVRVEVAAKVEWAGGKVEVHLIEGENASLRQLRAEFADAVTMCSATYGPENEQVARWLRVLAETDPDRKGTE